MEEASAQRDFREAVERNLRVLNQEVVELGGRTNELLTIIRENERTIWAQARVILALAAIGLQAAEDPIAMTEELRRLALEPLERDPKPEGDQLREECERLLGVVEAFARLVPRKP